MKMDYSAMSALARRFEKETKADKASRRLAERLAKTLTKELLYRQFLVDIKGVIQS